MTDVVEVLTAPPAVIEVLAAPVQFIEVSVGPRGPSGASPEAISEAVTEYLTAHPHGFEHVQSLASASWVIAHTLGRRPTVAVYIAGEYVLAEYSASSTSVNVHFSQPTAGTAVLT